MSISGVLARILSLIDAWDAFRIVPSALASLDSAALTLALSSLACIRLVSILISELL